MRIHKILKNPRVKKIHFIGIGGVSNSALAKYCYLKGYKVSGSDRCGKTIEKEFSGLDIKTFFSHSKENATEADAVVYTSAISADNEELLYSLKHKKTVKRSELLGEILSTHKTSVCVSGSHGKTTATAMIAHILICADKKPTVFLGGEDREFGNFLYGENKFAIAEACEYRKNFLDLKPDVAVVLNIDNDHQDSFLGFEDEKFAFLRFIGKSLSVVNADDINSKDVYNARTVTFGINTPANYSAKYLKDGADGYSFTAYKNGERRGRINLKVKGAHNVYNALAAFAVGDLLSVPFATIKKALSEFRGVKRRAEEIGEICGMKAVADYAHHPREIDAALSSLGGFNKNSLVVFQPHTYSRTEKLLSEFVSVLSRCKNLIIYKTYPAREKYRTKGSAKRLAEEIKKHLPYTVYVKSEKELKTAIESYRGKVKNIFIVGAGDIYLRAKKLLTKNDKIRAQIIAKKNK